MKFCKDNWKDIQKYFNNSYIKFPSISGDEAVLVTSVSSTEMTGKQLPDKDGATEWQFTYGTTNTEVNFILPLKSYFEYEGSAFLLYRNPARQYSRGICSENTTILLLANMEFQDYGMNLSLINAYTQKQAFTGFRAPNTHSYPISRRMAVDAAGRIMVDTTCIGHYNHNKKQVVLSQDMFVPEIERILSASMQEIEVITNKTVTRKPRKPKATYDPVEWTNTDPVPSTWAGQSSIPGHTAVNQIEAYLQELENENS